MCERGDVGCLAQWLRELDRGDSSRTGHSEECGRRLHGRNARQFVSQGLSPRSGSLGRLPRRRRTGHRPVRIPHRHWPEQLPDAVPGIRGPPDAAQRDSGNRIDTGDSRIFHATEALIRDGFGESHITFALTSACTFGSDPTVSACLECFRIRTFCVGSPSCDEVIEEQGIFGFGTNTFTFFPSVAMDVARNIIYNFSFSGTSFHPSAGSLARGFNSYSGSYFQDFGTHVYNAGNPARWGDYSSIFLDAVGQNPGRTLWSSTQTTIANDRWGTKHFWYPKSGELALLIRSGRPWWLVWS